MSRNCLENVVCRGTSEGWWGHGQTKGGGGQRKPGPKYMHFIIFFHLLLQVTELL